MEEILIYMLIKHHYIWDEVYNALRQKEPIDIKDVKDEYIKLCCKYVTVINEKYPLYLHDVLKPPFAIFYVGNIDLFSKQRICIEGNIKAKNLKYLKYLAAQNFVLCFKQNLIDEEGTDLLIKNHLPFVIYTKDLQCILSNDKLLEKNDKKSCCFVSEIHDEKYAKSRGDFYNNRFFYGRGNPIVIFDEDKIVDIQSNCYLLDSKIPIYVIADNSKKYENINNSQMQKINNFNEFKIVFINKN